MIGFRPKTSELYVERPRLLKLLPDSEGYVVWLEAPYGYGKSVLTSQWAEQLESEWRVLWLSVGGWDVKTALEKLLELPGETPWGTLLDELWKIPTVLVLEDLEGSEDLNPLLKDVRGLLLIASRNTLPYHELPRLKTQGRLTHLQAKQLAFTPEEAAKLFDHESVAKQAWERSQGWSLPLHFAALTGESPETEALLEGIQESLSEQTWQEALLLSALPYLPFERANSHTKDLAQKGFAQELESGFRLHPLAAEALQNEYLDDIQNVVKQEQNRLPLVLKAEAFARADLLSELEALLGRGMETNFELAITNPQGILTWDKLCRTKPTPGRLLTLAYAQSVLGQLEAAKQSYEAVVGHEAATPDQKLIALGWWSFDLPLEEKASFESLVAQARALFTEATPRWVASFLFNASAFPFSNHDWEHLEPLLHEALEYHDLAHSTEAEVMSVRYRLAQVQWELHGDTEQLLLATKENLRVQTANLYNAPVNHAALGRLSALLSDPRALHAFEEAERGATHNPATAISASAEKAALLDNPDAFPQLVAQFRAWHSIDPRTYDKIIALWARVLRLQGRAEKALDVLDLHRLEDASGLSSRAEQALALSALGQQKEAFEVLPDPAQSKQRFVRLELQAARYQLTRAEEDLNTLLELTTSGEKILPALIPLEALPKTRPELSKVYKLHDVLRSSWKKAIELRHLEIPDLELFTLGRLEAKVLGETVELTDRHKAILALLALGYDRETIGEALWPETEGKKVLNNLHVQLNLLRKTLEPWGLKTYLTEEGLARTNADICQLREALEQNDVKAVLHLYNEPFAPGVDLPLLDEARETLRQEVIEVLFEAAQTTDDGVTYLERLLELDPLHEEALQLLLRKLVSRGRKREAIKRYQSFASKLKTEMGLEPLDETRAFLE
jgi:DNA-binding SARP family transcriptional activator